MRIKKYEEFYVSSCPERFKSSSKNVLQLEKTTAVANFLRLNLKPFRMLQFQ